MPQPQQSQSSSAFHAFPARTRTATTFGAALLGLLLVLLRQSGEAAAFSVSPPRVSSASLSRGGAAAEVALRAAAASSSNSNHHLELLPDLTAVFDKIQQVSPLARKVMTGSHEAILDKLPWKTVERRPDQTVHQIDKLDNFGGIQTPLFRFRASLQVGGANDPTGSGDDTEAVEGAAPAGAGTAGGEGLLFGQYILDLDKRKKWDAQIEQVREVLSLGAFQDQLNLELPGGAHTLSVKSASSDTTTPTAGAPSLPRDNDAMNFGECLRLGIGYGRTKASLGITEREQMFWFGMQEFGGCGAYVLWGQEVDEGKQLPWPSDSARCTRAKSHLFSATLLPTSDTTFDVEYVVQLEIGGSIPKWLTTPVLIDTVKNLFRVASAEFAALGGGGISSPRQQDSHGQLLDGNELLLMAP